MIDNGQQHRPRPHRKAAGFTLIEIMVVIVIILLMLGMAVPVLHVITGSQSEAGATNIIAAMLSRARADAIGLQRPVGVAFIYNPSTQVQTMAEVELSPCPVWLGNLAIPPLGYVSVTNTLTGLTYYYQNASTTATVTTSTPPVNPTSEGNAGTPSLAAVFGPPLDMRPDTDLQALPAGIAVQTISNCGLSSANPPVRQTDGYLSLGVILFDGQGRLTSMPYGIAQKSQLSTSSGLNSAFPLTAVAAPYVGLTNYAGNIYQYGVASQFGLVVFQRNAFSGQGFPTIDPTYTTATTSLPGQYSSTTDQTTNLTSTQSKAAEDTWMDTNATPLLINRYTGTLIRAE